MNTEQKLRRLADATVRLLTFAEDGISPFYQWDDENTSYYCAFCREWHFTNHKPGCPLLEINRALAALEMGWRYPDRGL